MNRKIITFFQSHHQIANLSELRSLGLTSSSITSLVESGRLDRVSERVYRLPGGSETFERRCRCACASWKDTAIGGPAAGKLSGLRRMGDPPVLILAPHDMRIPDNDGIQVHRTLELPDADIIRREDGIRLTTPARTLFDLGRALDDDALASVVEQVLDLKLASLAEIYETNRRLSRRGRAGSGRLTRVLQMRGGAAAVQSDLEYEFEQAILKAGLPAPQRQLPVRLRNGQVIRVDFAWPAVKVAIEIDGDYFHDGFVERRRDKLRDRRLTAMGWAVSRVQQFEVRTGLHEAISDLSRTLRERSQHFGAPPS